MKKTARIASLAFAVVLAIGCLGLVACGGGSGNSSAGSSSSKYQVQSVTLKGDTTTWQIDVTGHEVIEKKGKNILVTNLKVTNKSDKDAKVAEFVQFDATQGGEKAARNGDSEIVKIAMTKDDPLAKGASAEYVYAFDLPNTEDVVIQAHGYTSATEPANITLKVADIMPKK